MVGTLLAISSLSLSAQQITGGYNLGYAKYKLGDIKSLQGDDNLIGVSNFDNKFSNGTFHDAYIGYKFSTHEIGLRYDRFSIDGTHLFHNINDMDTDLSSYIKTDVFLKGDAWGVYYKYHFMSIPINKNFTLGLNIGASMGIVFNDFDINFSFYRNDPSNNTGGLNPALRLRYEFCSGNLYFQPDFGVQLWYKNMISLNLSAGYHFNRTGNLKGDNYNGIIYIENYGKLGGVDWSGLRLSAGIGFAFSFINK